MTNDSAGPGRRLYPEATGTRECMTSPPFCAGRSLPVHACGNALALPASPGEPTSAEAFLLPVRGAHAILEGKAWRMVPSAGGTHAVC